MDKDRETVEGEYYGTAPIVPWCNGDGIKVAILTAAATSIAWALAVADGIIKAEPSALELINNKIQEAERQILLCSIATVISSLITVACVVYFW